MAYVSEGPVSTLPGASLNVPHGQTCDEHPDRLAVARVQGETDSFGMECTDMCQECLDAYKQETREADTSGVCDWCKQHKPKLRPRRDYEEGMSGPVYDVCDDCIARVNAEAEAELDSHFDDCDDDLWGDEEEELDTYYEQSRLDAEAENAERKAAEIGAAWQEREEVIDPELLASPEDIALYQQHKRVK